MRKIHRYFLLSVMALVTVACDSFLDINDNPNQATESNPQQVLPNALKVTAANTVSFNEYGSFIVGYIVNAGGFGGWSTQFTYNYTTADYNGLWSGTYDNLLDYQYVVDAATGDETLAYYEAIAKIMKAYNYQLLVDTYGNVPYTEALKGVDKLTPSYDSGEAIYQDLVSELNEAIDLIKNSPNANSVGASSDVMFGGVMSNWERFANTLKLKLLVRASMKPGSTPAAWVTTGFSSFAPNTAFLTDDAVVNPGYSATAGKQNPMWNTYHTDAAGATTQAGRSRIPSDYVFSFYNGNKLTDQGRGKATYRTFPNTPTNQLGENGPAVPTAPTSSIAWYVGTGTGANSANTIGIFKGRSMGQPLMLAAESYLLQSEAIARGFISGDAKASFESGIVASFRYLYKDVTGAVAATYNPTADAATYITANIASPLVNFDLATSIEQKMQAIITQKYIALNFIHGHEAWNEFRRTGYPAVSGNGATTTFASKESTSPRPDKLPTRIFYPVSEYSLNPENAPSGISQFTSRIFWDVD